MDGILLATAGVETLAIAFNIKQLRASGYRCQH
jgi:hypothetical protein